MPAPDYPTTHPTTRKQWRQWLEKNHRHAAGVWFIYFKKETGKPRVSYDEAVKEALCFGWIDSLPRKLDAERTMLKFTPRKPKSVWSQLNKTRVKRLIAEQQIQPSGLAAVKLAQQNGSWDTLTASDKAAKNNTSPRDLIQELAKNKKAKENFQQFSVSIRRMFLAWIDSAKRPETRNQRLKQTVLMAEANKNPGVNGFKL